MLRVLRRVGPVRRGCRTRRHSQLPLRVPSLQSMEWPRFRGSKHVPHENVPLEVLRVAQQHMETCHALREQPDVPKQHASAALWDLLATCGRHAPPLIARAEAPYPLVLARLAAWVPRQSWVRPLEQWRPPKAGAALPSLLRHLLEEYEVPAPLRWGLTFCAERSLPEATLQLSRAFALVHAEAGRGSSVREAMQRHLSPTLSKRMVAEVIALPESEVSAAAGHPLHALRRAQVASLGGAPWVRDAACSAKLAEALGTDDEEAFNQSALQWTCRQQDELAEPRFVTAALDYVTEMHRIDPRFTCSGKTAKSMQRGIEVHQLTTIKFEDDEEFEMNPMGIAGLFLQDVAIPAGTKIVVPYDGAYSVQEDTPLVTVRIAEILSLRRLIYEGAQLGNCLEDRYSSQVKYLSRVRARSSSFWSMTFVRRDGRVDHECLIEVWHRRQGHLVHQAEGPRPRTIPSPEAWYWLELWCAHQNLDLDEWECYS